MPDHESDITIIPKGLHAPEHEVGGIDEIDVTDLAGTLADPQPPDLHAAAHQDGGIDEISAVGLSGLLADDQHVLDAEVLLVAAALVHAARHQNGGADEISVAALSGLLADDQHVLDAEVLLVAAALVHAARHQNGGADEISVAGLSGLLADDQHVLNAEVLAVAEAIGVAAGLIATHAALLTGTHGMVVLGKPSDEIVNNSAVLQNDDDLVFAVGANEDWAFDMYIRLSVQTASDWKWSFAVPGGGDVKFAIVDTAFDVDVITNEEDITDLPDDISGATGAKFIHFRMLYIGAGNAGNVQLQWAQKTAVAENTIVKEASWLIGHRVN